MIYAYEIKELPVLIVPPEASKKANLIIEKSLLECKWGRLFSLYLVLDMAWYESDFRSL
jgi:hypothetical protein